jgi:hypothetical protein
MTDDLQQKINFLSEKLSIEGWKPNAYCYEAEGNAPDFTCSHGVKNGYHPLPAPDLLKADGHLMLEKALLTLGHSIAYWPDGEVSISNRWYSGANHDGDTPLALVLAAYDALHKE